MLNLRRSTEAVVGLRGKSIQPSPRRPSRRQLGGRQKGQCGGRLRTADHCGSGEDQLGGSTAVAKANLTNAEKQPLLEALAETLRQHPELAPPEIAITSVPTDPPGQSMASEPIKGTVGGVNSQDYKVVIYARSGDKWWAQPTAASPQTHIGNDGKWESETHGGTEFAALLVKASYQPEVTRGTIPGVGGDVIAVAKKKP
jgi:hypothetical protein